MKKICVIGGANIDICGSSLEPLRNYDSNPGVISYSFGGVGRNIAQILALLDQNVHLVTCFSSDYYGQLLQDDCTALGMDIADSLVTDAYPSSMYIAILDVNRDMKLGMSDMRILRTMSADMLDRALSKLDADDYVVIDANLDQEMIDYALEHAPCRTAADPVSTAKAGRLKPHLDKIAVFKPNQFEANELNGIMILNDEDARKSLNWFLEHGVKEILISLAERGILVGSEDGLYWYTHRQIDLENATGGGDSLLGAYISARAAGYAVRDAVQLGISAAVTEIEQDAVRRRSLSMAAVIKNLDTMEIKERKL